MITFFCVTVTSEPSHTLWCGRLLIKVPKTDRKCQFTAECNLCQLRHILAVGELSIVYMNQNNQMIMFNPERRLINAEKREADTNNSTTGNEGLYSQDLVKEWLGNSYIQHWN